MYDTAESWLPNMHDPELRYRVRTINFQDSLKILKWDLTLCVTVNEEKVAP